MFLAITRRGWLSSLWGKRRIEPFSAIGFTNQPLDLNLLLINIQGSKGIRQRPTNLCTSPMMIHKITPSADYN